jgi:hypothetical protein
MHHLKLLTFGKFYSPTEAHGRPRGPEAGARAL